jgi:2-phosphoglycerate kinase
MIIFIGGAPKIGKTIVARKISDKLGYFLLSTDDIAAGIKQISGIDHNHPFYQNFKYEHSNINDYYSNYPIKEIIKNYLSVSNEITKFVTAYAKSLIKHEKQNLIIEGIHLVPSLMDINFITDPDISYIALGNTSYPIFLEYAINKNKVKEGWLNKMNNTAFKRFIKFSTEYSLLYKRECQYYGLNYFEVCSSTFNRDTDNIVNNIVDKTNTNV